MGYAIYSDKKSEIMLVIFFGLYHFFAAETTYCTNLNTSLTLGTSVVLDIHFLFPPIHS